VVSIVVPAHNEAQVIGRLLEGLLDGARPGEFDIVVVPNGCSDTTARIAAEHPVRVIDSPRPSKAEALRIGDRAAAGFPRIYLDADVEFGAADARALAQALSRPGVLAAAPARRLEMAGRSWPVRWYYQVWIRLPEVRRGLFGRGVIGVSEEGHERLARLPQVVADDLAASQAFAPAERVVVEAAQVTVHPPRTWGDLLRRRVRAVTGVRQLEGLDLEQAGGPARTGSRDLLAMARREPWLAGPLTVFVTVTLLARRRARKADIDVWLRDESSRA
jgi:glycosyltransferase involved in cell wall biosynthesis